MNSIEFFEYTKRISKQINPEYRYLLKKHLFSKYDIINRRLEKFETGDLDKNLLGRELLKNKYDAIVFSFAEWLVEISEQNEIQLLNLQMTALIQRIISRYEKLTLETYRKHYNYHFGKILFDIVYEKFAEIHTPNIEFILNTIETFEFSEQENVFKIETFQGICNVAFNLSLFHVERSMKILNGQIKRIADQARAALPE